MQDQHLSKYADRMFSELFRNAFYIGRIQIYSEEERRPHKVFYIGYRDAFGVKIPEPKGYSYQIWPINWVQGRSKKLDRAVQKSLKGKFPEVRHNIQLKLRATHGELFIKPGWFNQEKATAFKKEDQKLPIRGKRRKKKRRKLLV